MAETMRLFSYGTLQECGVQLREFGRVLVMRPDVLTGFRRGQARIEDPERVKALGRETFDNLIPTGDAADRIEGSVLEVTPEELAAADAYEALDRYTRIQVRLESGTQAWVFRRDERT